MAERTVLECDGCQRPIEKSEVNVLLLGIPTGKFAARVVGGVELPGEPLFAAVHACEGCQSTLTLAQLNLKLRSRPA